MIRALLAGWALTAGLAAETHAAGDPLDDFGLAEVYSAMNYDGTHTPVEWTSCGMVNAFYLRAERKVYLCNELRTLPAPVIRFIYAHELAHGVVDQLDIPVTGLDETAADELAAFTLIAAGHVADVNAAAFFFHDKGDPENPYDEHPSDMRRAVTLRCYAMEDAGIDPALCSVSLPKMRRTWARLLHLGEFR